MNIKCVEGIVLSEVNYSESSKILSVLTKDYGLISIIAKGCRNLKSKLRGVSSKFTYGNFHIYYKEKGISTLTEVDVINSFSKIMNNIDKIAYASYILDLIHQVAKDSSDEELYNLLINGLNKINDNYDEKVISLIIELKLLDFLGIMPIIDKCCVCNSTKNIITISGDSGGYLCKNCQKSEKIYSEKLVKLLRMLVLVELDKITKLDISSEVVTELTEFVDDYYSRYAGLNLKSKSFLQDLRKY